MSETWILILTVIAAGILVFFVMKMIFDLVPLPEDKGDDETAS